ncbi:hypothetical protein PENSPDRAFT_166120 [Peniophora sp. CONT]|nr:hypothetical protein PENSPDRAFT_166120 [Peniophora sp. CONT]
MLTQALLYELHDHDLVPKSSLVTFASMVSCVQAYTKHAISTLCLRIAVRPTQPETLLALGVRTTQTGDGTRGALSTSGASPLYVGGVDSSHCSRVQYLWKERNRHLTPHLPVTISSASCQRAYSGTAADVYRMHGDYRAKSMQSTCKDTFIGLWRRERGRSASIFDPRRELVHNDAPENHRIHEI